MKFYTKESLDNLQMKIKHFPFIEELVSENAKVYVKSGICPFCGKKTFKLTESIFSCENCKFKGGIIDFNMCFDLLTFNEVIEKLAKRLNVKLDECSSNTSEVKPDDKWIISCDNVAIKFSEIATFYFEDDNGLYLMCDLKNGESITMHEMCNMMTSGYDNTEIEIDDEKLYIKCYIKAFHEIKRFCIDTDDIDNKALEFYDYANYLDIMFEKEEKINKNN